jgi:hypothetical protein
MVKTEVRSASINRDEILVPMEGFVAREIANEIALPAVEVALPTEVALPKAKRATVLGCHADKDPGKINQVMVDASAADEVLHEDEIAERAREVYGATAKCDGARVVAHFKFWKARGRGIEVTNTKEGWKIK